MSTATATLTTARVIGAVIRSANKTERRVNNVRQMAGLNSYGGLKVHNNNVVSLGVPVSTEQCFAKAISSMKAKSGGRGSGGALTATCSKIDEIFTIAAVMNGITLVGVAIGFVLLKIEATVEEAEE